MKKLTLMMLWVTMIACNKNETSNTEKKNNSVLWASNVETLLPMVQDTLWSKENWDEVYKYDKKAIFETTAAAVIAGKLKAYTSYPAGELSVADFKTRVEGITADRIAQMRFNESLEMDTVNYTLNKKVSFVSFNISMKDEAGTILGLKKLFDIKMNDGTVAKKE